MPGIFYQSVNRRRFLCATTKVLAGAVLIREWSVAADDASSAEKPVHFALLSDTHIPADPKNEYRGFFPSQHLEKTVPQVIDTHSDGVILNGDAARLTGEVADYEAVRQLLAPLAELAPIYIGLGNHDDRDHFFRVFQKLSGDRQKVSGKHVLIIEKPSLRFVILDSLFYTNKAAGLLGKSQRDWLGQFLKNSDERTTIIFVHHTLGDGDGELLDAERLFDVVRPHRKVKSIFYGHSHKYAFSQEDGIHLVNIPAVGYNFSDAEPVGWVDARFTSRGAELKLNAFAGNRDGDGRIRSLDWRS
jgi:3',5'-cyclic AMP phosphodiesterase CpdA